MTALFCLIGWFVAPVVVAGALPCKADDDGSLYVKWKEHRLKVWPHEIEVAPGLGAGAVVDVRCYDKPISAYRFKSQPSIWENPTGAPWDGTARLSQLRFFTLPAACTARHAGLRAANRVFDRACHEPRQVPTHIPGLRIQYCELALDQDPTSKRYTFVDYAPGGKPLALFCKAYRARNVEFCEVEYDIDATLIVRYGFNSLRVGLEDVVTLDKALREAFAQRISSFD